MHIERELAVKLELTLTETMTGYSMAPDKWLVSAANPPTYEAQTVHSAAFYIPSDPQVKASRTKDKGGLGQTFLSVVFPHPATRPATAQAIYQVSLYKRKLVEGVSTEKPFPLGSAKLYYTASHPWLDMGESEFKGTPNDLVWTEKWQARL